MNSIGQSSAFQPSRFTASITARTGSAVEPTSVISSPAESFVPQESLQPLVSPELQPPGIASRDLGAGPEFESWHMQTSTVPNASQPLTSSWEFGWQVAENNFPSSNSCGVGMNSSLGMNAGLGMASYLGTNAAYIPRYPSIASIPSKTWNWGWADQTK